ncbi:cytochrome P450 [Lipomyces kononenkoae]|uniref:Cytochrome P450 n=1 Tax=Lipomyces kononenkoae TaxID=34357 RepID=A0ACC3SYC7_LIPKO
MFAATIVVFGLAAYVGFRLFTRSPLSNIPGPAITAFTDVWILINTYFERRNRLIHELHHKYGPVVRLSPHEVSVSDPGYIKAIYINNYDKSKFYFLFDNYGVTNAFSAIEKQAHAPKRRVMHQFYSKSAVTAATVERCIRTRLDRSSQYFEQSHKENKAIDVLRLFRSIAMDVVTAFQFGADHGTDFIRDPIQRDLILGKYKVQAKSWFIGPYLPSLAKYITPKSFVESITFTDQWNLDNMRRSGLPPDSAAKKLIDGGFSEMEAASEIADHVVAGHETTAVALTYLCWHVAKHPEIQAKLNAEIRAACGPSDDGRTPSSVLPAFKDLDRLPYLAAVLQETLRLYAPIPASEPRVVPASGMWYSPSSSEYGSKESRVFIPGGAVISMQPWTLHRDPSVFPDPDKFDPERWIDSDSETLHKMNRSFMTFGAGIRMCVGMNLAMEDLKFVTAFIFSKYAVKLGAETTDDSMYMIDRYSTRPKANYCYIHFEER